jgi:hypothetical protein
MAKMARTSGNFAAKSKGEFARGHNLESARGVEVPLVISKGRPSHIKMVTYDILEQQQKEKMKLQEARQIPDSHDIVEEDLV